MLQHKKNHVRKHGKQTTAKAKSYLAYFHTAPGKVILLLAALLLITYLAIFFAPKQAVSPAPSTEQQLQTVNKALKSTIPFIENQGQVNDQVKYYSQLQNGTFFVDQQGGLTYRLGLTSAREIRRSLRDARQNGEDPAGITRKSFVIKESFQTDHPLDITASDRSQVAINSIIGNDASKWKKDLPAYNLLDLGEVYSGIKVQLQAAAGNVEKIFLVQPLADVQNIRLQLDGPDKLAVNEQGELELQSTAGTFKFTKPLAWQEIEGQKHDIEVSYRLIDDHTYGFTAGQYDKNYPLTIDPLLVSTYVGGTDWEGLREVMGGNNAMVIANGSLYVTAYTYSTDFPTTTGAFDEVMNGTYAVFVSKISLDLGTLEASTYLGGSSGASESIITADSTGNIFVAGNTSSTDFPGVTGGSSQPSNAGGQDGFIAKLNGDLDTLLAATYYGGGSWDWMQGLVYDPTGNVYVAVDIGSQITIARISDDLTTEQEWNTIANSYYGALARDADGKIFVATGCTDPGMIIKRANGFIPSYQDSESGSCDSYVARFSATLSLEASTYLGSAYWENDYTHTIAIHGSGANEQVFVIGDSSQGGSTGGFKEVFNNNPNTLDLNPSPTERIFTFGPLSTTASDDVYIVRFNRDLQTAAATVIGGSDHDSCPFLALNQDGEIYMTSSTYSNDMPILPSAIDSRGTGADMQVYAAKLNNDLTELLGATYFGGTNDENYSHIIVDDSDGYDVAYLLGETSSLDVPATTNGFQPSAPTGGDLYIAAFTCAFSKVCAITDLQATPGDTEMELTWSTPLGQILSIDDYEIHYSTDGFDTDNQTFVDGVSSAPGATVTGLVNGTDYSFRVYSIDSNDDYSPASNTVMATPTGTTPPAAITDLSASPADAEAYLDWTAPEDYGNAITSYEVHYSNNGFVSDDQTCITASCTDTTPGADITGLVNGTQYSFQVYSINVNGTSAVSNTATTTPLANAIVGSVEVHLGAVNPYLAFSPNVYNAISSGISDNDLGTQDINSLGTPRTDKFTGLIPPLARAVRYSFYADGALMEHDGLTYSAEDMTGATSVTLADDALSTNIPLGFTANLYGQSIDTIKISSNGFIYGAHTAVTATNSGCCGGQNLSSLSGAGLVGNDVIIAGDWADLYPPGAGTVKYKTIGTAPNRIFTVEFDNVSPCCDATGGNTFQIKIFETAQAAAAPVVYSILPDNGLIGGGTDIVISGTGFTTGATVQMGGTPATNVTVVSGSTITATSPAHTTGLVNITVTNPDTQAGTLTNGYEYMDNAPPNLNYCEGYQTLYGDTYVLTLPIAADDTAWWWGEFSDNTPSSLIPVAEPSLDGILDFSVITLYGGHVSVIKPDNTVWTWGNNDYGQLGDDSIIYRDAPVQVSGLTGITDVHSGGAYTTALKSDGTVWAWGRNDDGRLGDGTTNESHVPVQVAGLSNIERIYGSNEFMYAVEDDGSLWGWGPNYFEEIFPPGTGITKLVGADYNTLILKADGTVWQWYDGDPTPPVLVAGPTAIDIFSGGNGAYFAERDDGVVFGWGNNCDGQLGIGFADCSSGEVPAQVLGITGVDKIAGPQGDGYTMFLLDDGTLWVAGSSSFGMPLPANGGTPVSLFDLSDVMSILPGPERASILKNDGTIWSWGDVWSGYYLGNGTDTGSNVPVQAFPPCTNISPDHGPLTGGTEVTLTGSGFLAGATVTFDGSPATGVTVVSETQITATTPAHAVGAVDVTVTNTDNQSSTYTDGFTYMELAPTLTDIDPVTGSSNGYTPVTITGTNFFAGITVTFGTTPASNVLVEDSTTITADAPPHAPGLVDVTVTNTDLQSATLTAAFTYSGTPDLQITDLDGTYRNNPHIATTSDGDYLIVWNDSRNSGTSDQDIYAQKIDSTTGEIIWTTYIDGREITGQPNYQPYYLNHVEIAPDENAGAFLVWDTNTTWSNYDIYAHYIDSDGAFHANWESGGYPGINVSVANANHDINPSILYDNDGGVYVSWTEYSGSWPNYNIIVTHLDGATAAPTAGWPLTINNESWDDYSQLVSAPDGGVFVVSWGSANNPLYIRKYNSLGVLQSPFDPFYLDTAELGNGEYKSLSDGAGGVELVYVDTTGSGDALSVVHVDSAGTVIWDDIELEPANGLYLQSFDAINASADNFYVIFQYQDEVGGRYPVYARRVAPDGTFSARLLIAESDSSLQYNSGPVYYLAEDGYGGIMVTYTQTIEENQYISVSQLDTNDVVTTHTYGLENISAGYPTITMNGTVGAISWSGYPMIDSSDQIFARLISSREPANMPTVTSIIPDNGPLEGGTAIVLTGTNFETGNTSVTFGRTLVCQDIVVVNDTTITCTTPPGNVPGPLDVFGATSEGSYNVPDGFTYTIPTRDTIEIHTSIPAEPDDFGVGISNGDDTGAVADINFIGAPTSAGLDSAEAYSFNSGAPTRTVVSQNFESRTWTDILGHLGIDPLAESDDDYGEDIDLGFTATLYGRDIDRVRVTSNGFVYLNNSTNGIQGTDTAPGIGYSMSDYANLPDGTNGTATGDLLVAGAWGNLDVTKIGSTPSIRYYLDTTNQVLTIDFTDIEHATSAGTIHTQIKIKGNGVTGDNLVPTITSVVPNQGPQSGGNSVTVNGSNFLLIDPPVVIFDDPAKTCSNLTILSTTSLTCTVPAGDALGSVDVTVSNSTLQPDTLVNGYTYVLGIGEAQWPNVANPSPVIVDDGVGWSWDGRIVRTSDDNFVTVIEGNVDNRLNAQKISPSGQKLWNGGEPVVILNSNASGVYDVLPDADSGGIFIAHGGDTVNNHNEYVSRMDTDGNVLWTAGTFETNSAVYDSYPRVTSDGNDGVYVTWTTWDNLSPQEAHMTHLGPDGAVCEVGNCGVAWNVGGSGTYRPLTLPVGTITVSDAYLYPIPTPSDAGSIIVTYYATTTPDYYIVKINPDGSNDWGPTGTYLSYTDSEIVSFRKDDFQAEPDGDGGVFIAYGGDDGVDFTVRIVRIDTDGNFVLGSTSGGMVTDTVVPDGGWGGSVHSTSANDGNLYLLWNNYPPRVQKYDGSGTELWPTGGVSVTQNEDPNLEDYVQTDYRYNTYYTIPIVPDGLGGVVVVGTRDSLDFGNYITVFVQRIDSNGNLQWGNSYSVNKYPYYDGWNDYNENVASDGNGGAVVLWNRYDYYGEEVDSEDYYSAVQYVKAGVLGAPEVYDINPAEGPTDGGTTVVIRGRNFVEGAVPSFNSVAATNVTVVSSNVITATTPAHGPGLVDVEVTTSIDSGTLTNGFNYIPPAPTVDDATPVNGTIAGGTTVTITGTGFQTDATVDFDGVNGTVVAVDSDTQIRVLTPPHAAGLTSITVTNTDAQSGTLVDGFEYISNPPPSLHHCVDYTVLGVNSTNKQVFLANDGTIWNWGSNFNNQLGSGIVSYDSPVPVQAVGLSGTFTKFADGFNYTLALKSDGTVWAWGANHYGMLGDGTNTARTTPVQVLGLTDITDIDAGEYHSIALKNDGTVWTWGYNSYGQIGDSSYSNRYTPAAVSGISTAQQISASRYSSHVRLANGTVWGWGRNNYGQLGNNSIGTSTSPVQAIGLTDVAQIVDFNSAYTEHGSHMLAVKNDGTVWAWGRNEYGQLGVGYTSTYRASPIQVKGIGGVGNLSNVESVYATSTTSFALHNDGTITSWGYNAYGNLGTNNSNHYSTALYPTSVVGLTDAVSTVLPSATSIYALLGNGTLMSWGYNGNGQLGDGTMSTRSAPVPVSGLGGITAIGAAWEGSAAALRNDGTIWVWGRGSNGQLGNGLYQQTLTPIQPLSAGCILGLSPTSGPTEGGTSVTISGANFDPLAEVTFDGAAAEVVYIDAHTLTVSTPAGEYGTADIKVTNPDSQSDTLTAGYTYTSDLPFIYDVTPNSGRSSGGTAGTITGTNFKGGTYSVEFDTNLCADVLVLNDTTLTCTTPASTGSYEGPVDVRIITIYGDDTLIDGFTYTSPVPTIDTIFPDNGPAAGAASVLITGSNFTDADGDVNLNVEFDTGYACNNVSVAPDGLSLTCTTPAHAVGPVDVVITTDYGTDTLSDGYTYTTTPTPDLQACTGFIDVQSGGGHTLALASNGTVWAWGNNGYGQLGDNSTTDSAFPVQVEGLSGITAIRAGNQHSAALKNDGTVWAWGYNNDGELGDGSTVSKSVPVLVRGLVGVTELQVYGNHSMALKNDGTLWGWGTNYYGSLGDGGTANRTSITRVTGLTDVSKFYLGNYHAFAIKDDGTVWAWGSNSFGQLGTGLRSDSYVPIQITGISNVEDISLGTYHTLALKTDDTVWAWGHNTSGSVGNGTWDHQDLPVQVFADAASIEAGPYYYSYAVKNDGTVWAWGANDVGQLGDGTFNNKNVPTKALKLSAITNIVSAPYDYTLALKNDGTVWAWGNNEEGEVGDGTLDDRNSPAQVGTLSGVAAIRPYDANAMVLKTDGTIWGWGYNGAGALGDGTFIDRLTPVQTTALVCNGIVPDYGTHLGGTSVTIHGTNFLPGATVTFDGIPATGTTTVVNVNTITTTTPAHAPAIVDVVITNPDTQFDTLANGYEYTNLAVTESIVPNSGPSAGGTQVTLTGINYTPGTTVDFDGLPATNVTVLSDTQLTCDTPAHGLGPSDVVITNANGDYTLPDGFSYTASIGEPGEWITAGTPIDGRPTPDAAVQHTPYTITASDGNYIAGWGRLGLDGDNDIAVQKITAATGTHLWPDDGGGSGGMRISDRGATTYNQSGDVYSPTPMVPDNNGGAYLVWTEVHVTGAPQSDLMLQRVGSDGSLIYGNDPKNLSNNDPGYEVADYAMITDGNGGVYVAWTNYDNFNEENQVRMKRITAAGTEYAVVEDIAFPVGSSRPRLGLDSKGNAYVSFERWYQGDQTILTRLIAPDGSIPSLGQDWFNSFSLPMVTDEYIDQYSIVIDSNDDIIFVYVSQLPLADWTISAQKISHTGESSSWFTPGVGGVELGTVDESYDPYFLQTITDGNDGAIALWEAHAWGSDLYMQKINTDGQIQWGAGGLWLTDILQPTFHINNLNSLTSDGFGGAIVSYQSGELLGVSQRGLWAQLLGNAIAHARSGDLEGGLVHLQKINSAGTRLWPSGEASGMGYAGFSQYTSGDDYYSAVTGDGQGGAAMFWFGQDNTTSYVDIYGQYYKETNIPTITGIMPNYGPTAGGTSVSITGTNLNSDNLVIWFGDTNDQCTDVTVISSTRVTCQTPAHAEGAVDVIVVNSNGYDTLTAGYTYGDDIICTSDGINTFCGSQTVGGCPATTTGFTDSPNDFQFGSLGSRFVTSLNDTAHVEATNGAYFDETTPTDYSDTTDTITINSNTGLSCGSEATSVTLSISATPFKNGSNQDLVTYGADHLSGGSGADEDYYGMLSVFTSDVATCTDPCTPASGNVESSNEVKNGQNNFFANPTANDGSLSTSFGNTAVLLDKTNTPNTVVLYDASTGFDGDVTIPGLDYVLAIPANIQNIGSFSSIVTYTLS